MNSNEEFDELARRKLEERQIPFQEADWQNARSRIDAQRGGGNKGAWITGAVALLLVGGLAWYGTGSSETAATVAANQNKEVPSVKAEAIDQNGTSNATTLVVPTPNSATTTTTVAISSPSVGDNSVKSIPVHSAEQALAAETAANATAKTSKSHITDQEVATVAHQPKPVTAEPKNADVAIPATSKKKSELVTVAAEPEAVSTNPLVAEIAHPHVEVSNGSISETFPQATELQSNLNATNGTTSQPATPANGTTQSPELSIAASKPETSSATIKTEEAAQVLEIETPSSKSTAIQQPAVGATSISNGSPVSPQLVGTGGNPLNGTTPSSTDSASTAITSPLAVEDSAMAATPPPLVPERAPWEISVLGGMFSSTTKYSGSNSADWNANISKANSVGMGAELMHMGRNFGIGAGLHYATYAEQLRTEALDRTTFTLQNFWYLNPVDTTILVITDTIPGTPPTYTGTSTNTTVNVLTQGTDTTNIATERIREARNELNRVSYLEIPLLLDAHMVQGRWSCGVRGGPTVGLLTGRRGAIPAPDNEGFVSFADQPFREVIFGYSARAYVRYRFNAAWSVGIEPAVRGQLMNSLGSGDLVRKASAKGMMLSLSYRLR